jgi:hypothetical protein
MTHSYSNGSAVRYYTLELQRAMREAEFPSATTSRNGFGPDNDNLNILRRVQVSGSLEELAFALEVERFSLPLPPRGSEER